MSTKSPKDVALPNKAHNYSGFEMDEFSSSARATSLDQNVQIRTPCNHRCRSGDPQNNFLKSEMVTSSSCTATVNKLCKSAFVSTCERSLVSDDEYIEKQAAKEQELADGKTKLHRDASSFLCTSECSYSNGPEPTSDIPPEMYPAEFKEHHFDCVLIYSESESDLKYALNFKDILEKHLKLEDGRSPAVCILDRGDNLTYVQSRFKHSDVAMERSTYMFLLLTKDFVNDAWAEMQKDECLMVSISEPERKWCVVPLYTKSREDLDFNLPYGLRALKGIDISAFLPDKNLECVDPKEIQLSDLDEYLVKNLTKMFNERLGKKKEREQEQENKLKLWIQEKKIKLMKEKSEAGEWQTEQRKKISEELKGHWDKLQNSNLQDAGKLNTEVDERFDKP